MNQIKHTIERTEKNCGGHIEEEEEEEEDDDDDEHALFSYCASPQILVSLQDLASRFSLIGVLYSGLVL